jgi:hypothetical protein
MEGVSMKRKSLSFRPGFLAKILIICLTLVQAPIILQAHDGIAKRAYAAAIDHPLYKSTYLWDTNALLGNRENTFQFLQQNGINLVFLQVDTDVPQVEYSGFIQEATERGIEVHALGGAPNWTLRDQQIKLYKLIDWVKVYNNSVPSQAQFKGIHLDVEPYVSQEWYQDTDTMIGLWRDTVSGFVEEMRLETPGLIAGAAMPVWIKKYDVSDGHGGRTTLSNWMIRTLDQTTLMAYRDTPADIISSVTTGLDEAENNGKSVIVAVETLPSTEGPITFYNKGKKQMMQDLGTVTDTLKGRVPFAGYAVHDFAGWERLKD